jgi:HlyD family secretion protein
MRSRLVKVSVVFLVILLAVAAISCTRSQTTAPTAPPAASPLTSATAKPGSPSGLPPSGGPASKPASTPAATGTAPGSLASTVKGAGTITVDRYANLYFGTAGQIAVMNVKVGDQIKKGAVLAKLDTTSLEAAVAQATVNLDQAKLAQTQAKSSVVTAQYNLDKTKAVSDIKDAITDDLLAIKVAEVNQKQAQAIGDSAAIASLNQNLVVYQKDLKAQQDKLAKLLSQDPYTSADVAIYINGQKYDRLTVQDIQNKQLAINIAEQTVDKSQATINQTQKALDVAQLQLSQATIVAPFDAIVATVNQNAGDIVSAPSAAGRAIIYIIDPGTLQLIIGINELDMPKVKSGQKANVVLDAYPDSKIEGKVSVISPLPTVQGGITDYNITITFPAPANVDVRIGMNATAAIVVN